MSRRLLALSLLVACRPAATQSSRPSQVRDDLAACEAGDAEACFDHGATFQFPATGVVDLARAIELYDRSCSMGYALACMQASQVLYHGVSPRDDERIAAYIRRACELKIDDACAGSPGAIGGVMPKEAIRTVVRGNIPQVRACYNAGLANNPRLEGRVRIQFAIEHDGRVDDVALVENLADDPEVGRCIAGAASQWRFPAPFGRVIVEYPFVLEPG